MIIERFAWNNFRNLPEGELIPGPGVNVIRGLNAQGKTNLLEAIVYLSCGKSPRTRSDRELITFDGQQARITGIPDAALDFYIRRVERARKGTEDQREQALLFGQ